MNQWPIRAVAFAVGLVLAGPVLAETTYHVTGDIEITVIPAAGCIISAVNLPTGFSGPAANHGQTVGPVTFTSDVACATPPAIMLSPGSVFALAGSTLPTDLLIGPSDVAGGIYPATATVTTAEAGGQSIRVKSILLPGPATPPEGAKAARKPGR